MRKGLFQVTGIGFIFGIDQNELVSSQKKRTYYYIRKPGVDTRSSIRVKKGGNRI
ncbi:MAG: hypothetical protein AB1629_06035 [Candidatus Omnitrophota bacterium]